MAAGAEAALSVVVRLRDEMTQQMTGLKGSLSNFASEAGKVGLALSAGVSLPLIAIGKQAVEVASTFEAQMNVLGVAARSSGTAMEDLSKAAILVGADTQLVGINASQAADAMTNFYKSGMTTAEIFGGDLATYLSQGTNLTGALRAAIDLAAASEMDLNQSSMLVAASMATFGLSAADATRISNSFVGAADASLASVSDLAQGMANIGPTAAAFGWSIEETNTALAVLSTRGILGAEAGTALKSMMINLMAPTKDNTAALQALNVQLYDSEGRMKPLPTIIGDLSRAMAGMTEEQRLNTIQTLAGSYGQKAMNTLLAEGVPGWNAMATAVANAATAQEVAAARTQGFKAALEQLRGAIESVFIQVVTPILQTVLTPFIRLITEAASSVLTLNPALLNAVIAFGAVVAAAGPVLLAIKGIALVVGALTSPIGLVILALAALAAAWTADFLGMRTTLTTWWSGVQPKLLAAATGVKAWVGQAVKDVASWWATAWPAMKSAVSTWWSGIGPTLSTAYTTIRDKVGQAARDVASWWATAWPAMKSAVSTWWSGVSGTFATAYTTIRDKVGQAARDVASWWATAWPAMKSAVTTWWSGIGPTLSTAYTTIRDKVGQAVKDVSGWWATEWPKMKSAVTTWWSGIGPTLSTAYTTIRDKVGQAVKDVSGWWATEWPKMRSAVDTWWSGVQPKLSTAYTTIRDKVGQAVKDVAGWWATEWPKMRSAVDTWWTGVQPKLAEAVTWIKDKTGGAVKDLSGWFAEHWPKMKESVTTWWNAIDPMLKGAVKAVETFNTALGELYKKFDPVGKAIEDLKKNFDPLLDVIEKIIIVVKDINDLFKAMTEVVVAAKEKAMEYIEFALTPLFAILFSIIQPIKDIILQIQAKIEKMEAAKKPIEIFTQALEAIARALDWISSAVQGAISWLENLAAAIRNLPSPPSWLTPGSPTPFELGLLGISAALEPVVEGLNALAAAVGGIPELEAAQNIAEGLASIAEATVRTAEALRAFKPVDNLGLITGKIMEFLLGVELEFQKLVAQVDEGLAAKAKELAEAVAPVINLIAAAMESLRALNETLTYPSELIEKLHALTDYIGQVVLWFGTIGNAVADDLQTAAKKFAENAGPPVGLIAAAMESLRALSETLTYPSELIEKLHALTDYIGQVVFWMGTIGNAVADDLQAAAKKFAENAGPPVELVVTAVETLAVLGGQIVMPTELIAKLKYLTDVIGQIVFWMGTIGKAVADDLQTEAKKFAENAGPPVELVVTAIETLAVLGGTIVMPTDLAAKLETLSTFLAALITKVGTIGGQVTGELQTAARTFAENAGPVIEIVVGAVEAMAAMGGTIVMPTDLTTKLQDLSSFIGELITWVGAVALKVKDNLQTAAKTFGENAGPVVGIVVGAVEAMAAMGGKVVTPTGLTTKLQDLSSFIGELITSVGTIGGQVTGDLQTAAKTFGENAGPVIGIVVGAVEAMAAMGGKIVMPDDLATKLETLSTFVSALITKVGTIGGQVTGDLQTAAKTFGENAGPVVGIVVGAVEAMAAMSGEIVMPTDLAAKLETLSTFVTDLITKVGEIGGKVTGDLQTAAKSFAENAGPVFDLTKTALELILTLEAAKKPNLATLEDIMKGIGGAIALILTRTKSLSETAVGDALPAIKTFSTNVTNVMKEITGTLETLKKIGELNAPAIGLAWVTELHTAMTKAVPSLTAVMNSVVKVFTGFTPSGALAGTTFMTDLGSAIGNYLDTVKTQVAAVGAVFSGFAPNGWWAGKSFMTSLAAGITAGLSVVEAALAAVAALFPHSPAKAGPLKKAPDWDAYLNMGLQDAAAGVARVLGGVGGARGMSLAPALASGASGGSSVAAVRGGGPTVINFVYSPTVSLANQREAQEVIAPILAEVLRREARRG